MRICSSSICNGVCVVISNNIKIIIHHNINDANHYYVNELMLFAFPPSLPVETHLSTEQGVFFRFVAVANENWCDSKTCVAFLPQYHSLIKAESRRFAVLLGNCFISQRWFLLERYLNLLWEKLQDHFKPLLLNN